MKLYLKTKTEDLTTPQLRKIVGEVIKFMKENAGKRKRWRESTFKYKVIKQSSGKQKVCGWYSYKSNTLVIFKNNCIDVKFVIRTVLHEYTHYLQNLRHYQSILKKVGYKDHPLEIHANAMEYFYPRVWKSIKNKL